jgi:hypothetical protein
MSDSDHEQSVNNPYRDDPDWAPWHAEAVDVQGGPDDDTSSDEEESDLEVAVSLPETCVCKHCRLVYDLTILL